ncbi:MAG: S8 family serine peptidase, partial [Candidatus Limnocylindrales bacterium]
MARSTRRSVLFLVTAALVAGALHPGRLVAADIPAAVPIHPDAKPTVQLIVSYKDRPGRASERAIERLGGTVRRQLTLADALAVEVPRDQAKALRNDPAVETVEIDASLQLFDHAADTGDIEYENAWGVEHIGSREVHLAGNTGQGIKVAIIDTGIDYVHDDPVDSPYVVDPEFLGNYVGGYDFYNGDDDPY